ncbi:hypothetical protein TWF173_008540 [Orbilia oligospora]|uniref:RRM domain-containing protein n=1 Tax=Arthrobotrys oligospora (strain ATCC 24927 / CBS 115.81 / DSM 1491) TaxID=756982 RepID=G1XC32_ARTOA|nr:hypothetical protein AOL_s00078g479 [Orbilia oligospora ATCC 24927]EGX49446.1 hypothetical protein AOL_s00078g479 [Orbilia oligospora ATCC 24927]KAF3311243.1 hypothetical protein TWF173_008540 [Orbilia oligospora]
MSTADVEKITAGVAATNIKEDNSASTVAAAEGRRLYIGNLAYTTTEDQLKDFFKGYSIESVSIPVNPRTSRAVGYAFVDVAKKEEADKAITELSGKEILERKVSVQVARKPGTSPAAAANGEAPNNGDKRAPRRGRGGFRGGRSGGRGSRFRPRSDSTRAAPKDTITADPTETPAPSAAAHSTPVTAITEAPKTTTTEAPAADADKGPRGPRRKRGPPENGVASTTKVMVANLPYELSESALKELFAAYNPESAKIALRPIPRFMVRKLQARGEARKGRGFGFVTLPSEEMQKKAVDEMNGKVVEGREIAVKVAIDNPKDEEGEAAEDAPANGETAITTTTTADAPDATTNTTAVVTTPAATA